MATASLQSLARQSIRTAKNYTKGYSDTQTKVREATSNDPWGPSGTQMNEIAQLTFNQQDFVEIMEVMDKRLNDKGKNWRHVFKSLTLLDYMIHAGSENVVVYFKENLYIVKTLKEFVFMDEEGKDQGANVRQKAKDITSMLLDEARLKEARKGRQSMRDRLSGSNPTDTSDAYFDSASNRSKSTPPARRGTREDDDMRRAIEESKRMAEDQDRSKSPQVQPARRANNEDDDLAKALRLSKEEDEERKRALERNQNGLFDEQQKQQQQQSANQLIDFDNGQQQQQTLPQFTGFNSFNPYAAQQLAQQEEYLRMQAQMAQLEQQRQAEAQAAQQQAEYQAMMQQQAYFQQQQQQQQQQQAQYLHMQHTMQTQPLVPQPTAFGSNNPFANFQNTSSPPMPSFSSSPSLPSLQEYAEPQVQQSSPRRTPTPANPADERHAHLASLIGGGGSGVDSFGNVGNLRVPGMRGGTNPFNAKGGPAQQPQASEQPFFSV